LRMVKPKRKIQTNDSKIGMLMMKINLNYLIKRLFWMSRYTKMIKKLIPRSQ